MSRKRASTQQQPKVQGLDEEYEVGRNGLLKLSESGRRLEELDDIDGQVVRS